MKRAMQNDAARTEDVIVYNIIPLDALSTKTNAFLNFPEVIVYIMALFLLLLLLTWMWS
jgi:callose synthase